MERLRIAHQLIARLVTLEVWIVGGLVAVSIVFERFLPVAVLGAGLFWALRWLVSGGLARRTPIDWAVALLVAMLPVSLWVTAFPDFTRPQVLRLVSGIALFYALVNWLVTEKRLRFAMLGVIAGGLLLAGYGLFTVEWNLWKVPFFPQWIYDYLPRLRIEIIHRNVMAAILVFLLPMGTAWLLFGDERWKRWERWFVGGATGFVFLILILTQGRAAWMAFAIVLLVLAALRWKWGWLGLALTSCVLAVLVFVDIPFLRSYGKSVVDDMSVRIEIWSRAIDILRDFSWTGVGMGAFNPVANALYPFFFVSPDYSSTPHAHNLLLQIGVDLGLPGLIAWLAIWLGITTCAWGLYRLGQTGQKPWVAGLGAGFLGSQLALVLHGIMDANTWGMIRPAPLVWGIWALVAAAWIYYSRSVSEVGDAGSQPVNG